MSNNMHHEGLLRIHRLLDEQSFVEIKSLHEPEGVVTGYGQINGELIFIYAQDSQCMGGSFGEFQCKKIASILRQARKMKAPVIGILDSTGLGVQEGILGLEALGEVFFALKEAKKQIPVYTIISGICGGSIGLIPQMSDFVFLEKSKGECFVNSPNTLSKNLESGFESESAKAYLSMVDFEGTLEEIKEKLVFLYGNMPQYLGQKLPVLCDTDDFNRTCDFQNKKQISMLELLKEISDSGNIFPIKDQYCKELFTGFIILGGKLTGVIATMDLNINLCDESRLNSNSMKKASRMIQLCTRFNIPVLTILNNDGIETTVQNEQEYLLSTSIYMDSFIDNEAPKICLIPDHVYGGSYSYIGSKSIGNDLVIAWDCAQIGVLSQRAASKISNQALEIDNSVSHIFANGIVDCIIMPEQTRNYLISLFDMLSTKTI